MKRKNDLPELLAPAGDIQCLYAAVKGGADAVYVGGRSFGARAFAKNFDIDELAYAVRYCHIHGVKLYVTVNTLVYDREMRELSDYVAELWRIGVDAVITADLGVIREIKRRVPNLPIHASTQMSVHNTCGADEASRLGCERVVLARELSYSNIVSVTEQCAIETEVFLHGALCVCHSGQCLFSSLVGGRSGNRGECAQPCRLPYGSKYPLSLSDLSLANHIEELIKSGVASLKIEGRMKSPEYVYIVTRVYRNLLDEGRNASKKEEAELKRVFSRGDFTDGYFTADKFKAMTGVRSKQDKENSKQIQQMEFIPEKVCARAEVAMKLGEPSEMTLILNDGRRATVKGAVPTEAISSPLRESDVKERLSKMGATLLSLSASNISLSLGDEINLPPSAINALRRDAADALTSCERNYGIRDFTVENLTRDAVKELKSALFLRKELYLDYIKQYPLGTGSFDIVFLPLEQYEGESNGVYIPPVIFDSEVEDVKMLLKKAKDAGAVYALVGNIGHIKLVKDAELTPIGDFRLNITNSYSKAEYKALGIESFILSPEITLPMARDIGGGEIVYGRIPLMLTERCFIKENFGCEKCNNASFKDRTGSEFPIIKEYGHRNLILNSLPTYMGDKKAKLKNAKISHHHFIFSVESVREANFVIAAYNRADPLKQEVRRIGKR